MTSASSPWDRFLMIAVSLVGIYGVVLVVAGLAVSDSIFAALGFGLDDGDLTTEPNRRYAQLIYAVLGSVIVGWSAILLGLIAGPLRRRERWAWRTIVAALTSWFVLDTGMSLLLGFPGHALFNVGFAVALAVPLATIRSELNDHI